MLHKKPWLFDLGLGLLHQCLCCVLLLSALPGQVSFAASNNDPLRSTFKDCLKNQQDSNSFALGWKVLREYTPRLLLRWNFVATDKALSYEPLICNTLQRHLSFHEQKSPEQQAYSSSSFFDSHTWVGERPVAKLYRLHLSSNNQQQIARLLELNQPKPEASTQLTMANLPKTGYLVLEWILFPEDSAWQEEEKIIIATLHAARFTQLLDQDLLTVEMFGKKEEIRLNLEYERHSQVLSIFLKSGFTLTVIIGGLLWYRRNHNN